MCRLVLVWIMTLVFVSFVSWNAYAADRMSPDVLFPILVSVEEKAIGPTPLLATKIHNIHREFSLLVTALEKLSGGVPTQYEQVFAEYGHQLIDVSLNLSAPSSMQIAQELFDDLQIKNRFITTGFGFSSRSKYLVSLQVTTINAAGALVNGYQVTCNPRRFAGARPAIFPFSKLTSPAQQFVPPGIYTLEIMRGGQPISTLDVRVGLAGNESEDVQVEIQKASHR